MRSIKRNQMEEVLVVYGFGRCFQPRSITTSTFLPITQHHTNGSNLGEATTCQEQELGI
jgi:hypothetical protein